MAATANAQRYNPELPWSQRGTDPRIAHLGDKLRHLRQLVLSQLAQLAQTPESDSFVRDEEGSGSGHDGEAQWTTDDEDRNPVPWSEQGSGSGDEPIGEQMRPQAWRIVCMLSFSNKTIDLFLFYFTSEGWSSRSRLAVEAASEYESRRRGQDQRSVPQPQSAGRFHPVGVHVHPRPAENSAVVLRL